MSGLSAEFESIYLRSADDSSVPWAQLSPNSALTAWLDTRPEARGAALVVGCGLGDDAEELSARGWQVTAFDVAPTAIDRCRSRFPNSTVHYAIADVLSLPPAWTAHYHLVVEIRTLQCLLPDERPVAARALAATMAAGGSLYLRCYRLDEELTPVVDGPPWPLAAEELGAFEAAGLIRESLATDLFAGAPGAERGPTFTGIYRRP